VCKRTKFRTRFIIICSMLVTFLFSPSTNNSMQAQGELNARVVLSFPSPGPSPQGLAWDGSYLWLVDDSTDMIYKINPINGQVDTSFTSPGSDPKGLTFEGIYLWSLDNELDKIFKLNLENGSIIKFLELSHNRCTALTWDGTHLWSSFFAGFSSRVFRIDPETGITDTFFYGHAEGLTFDGTYLWTLNSQWGFGKGFVMKRTIPSGDLIEWFRTPGKYPTGLTFDGIYFWLTDSGTDTIDKISLKGDVNNDGVVNILDVIRCVDIILVIGDPPTEYELWAADYNWDGEIDVIDAVRIVNEILGSSHEDHQSR
jgi:DNA-binding beta-propeller fold protein YncE